MDRENFVQHLLTATERARDFATKYVTNALPSPCRYLIEIESGPVDRMRADGGPFPIGTHRFRTWLGPLGVDDVLAFLWRDGAVPRWININAHSTDGEYTYLQLAIGQFQTDDSRHLYGPTFAESGLSSDIPPFLPNGAYLPPNWHSLGPNEKFDLHWWSQ